MVHVLWEFKVLDENRAEFESSYKGNGVWARLFRNDPAYVKTLLVKDQERAGRYLTIDVWTDMQSYLRFKDRFAQEYARIDAECESLTDSEKLIGIFEELG